jgi:bla regulator protein BlaR1
MYDWAIEWIDQSSQAPVGDPGLPSSVFSAVQEQLGLKLEPATGSVPVVVIDNVEKPASD